MAGKPPYSPPTGLGRYPILRLLPPFALGIVVAAFITEGPVPIWLVQSLVIGFLCLCGLIYVYRHRVSVWVGVAMQAAMAVGGLLLTLVHTPHLFPNGLPMDLALPDTVYQLRLLEDPQPRARSYKTVVELTTPIAQQGQVLVYLPKDSVVAGLKAGDLILAHCQPLPTRMNGNPGEFNYPRFLRFKGIYHQCYIGPDAWRMGQRAYNVPVTQHFINLRTRMLNIFQRAGLEGQEFAVAAALTLGHKSEIDRELLNDYSGSGAMHVLSVSGLHVGLIYKMLEWLIKLLWRGRKWEKHRAVVLIVLLFAYAAITGLSASVLRSTVMFGFVAGAKLLDRHTSIFNTLACSALALLAWQPYMIMEVGFQLSYLAVFGIVAIQPYLLGLYEFKHRWADQIWSLTCVSLAAQLVTFPLGLLYFHQFPSLFLISNLLVIPVATGILWLMFPLLIFSCFDPILQLCGWLMKMLVMFLNGTVSMIENLPNSVVSGVEITVAQTLVLYVFISGACIVFMAKRPGWALPSLAALIAFIGLDTYGIWQANRQQLVTIYNLPKHAGIAVFSGREVEFYADSALINDTASIDFHVRHHWWAARTTVQNLNPVPQTNGHQSAIINLPNRSIWLVEKEISSDVQSSTANDILLINKVRWNEIPKLAQQFNGNTILMTSTLGDRTVQQLRDAFRAKPSAQLIWLKEAGAYPAAL